MQLTGVGTNPPMPNIADGAKMNTGTRFDQGTSATKVGNTGAPGQGVGGGDLGDMAVAMRMLAELQKTGLVGGIDLYA